MCCPLAWPKAPCQWKATAVLVANLYSPVHMHLFNTSTQMEYCSMCFYSARFVQDWRSSQTCFPLSQLRTIPLECLPPKRSFPFTCCEWFRYPVSAFLLRTSSFSHALPQCNLIPIYRTAKCPFYIRLSFSTTNTAWSMRHIPIYLTDNISCILFNFNLLDSPLVTWISQSLHATLECMLPCNLHPWNSLSNRLLPGVVAEAPNTPLCSWRHPSRNLGPLPFQVYACLCPSQA